LVKALFRPVSSVSKHKPPINSLPSLFMFMFMEIRCVEESNNTENNNKKTTALTCRPASPR